MLRNRRWSRRVVAGTAGVALAVTVTPALSAAVRDGELPVPGVNYELKLSAPDAQFTVQGQECSVSLAGSVEAEAQFEAPQDSLDNTVPMNFGDMRMRGSSSSCQDPTQQAEGTSNQEGLGQVRIKQNDTEFAPQSVVTMTGMVPPTFEQTVFMNFTMTIENPPRSLRQRSAQQPESQPEPLVLTTKQPAELVGQLESIPPQGASLQLQNPIELVVPNHDETIATLEKFPVTVGDLSGS